MKKVFAKSLGELSRAVGKRVTFVGRTNEMMDNRSRFTDKLPPPIKVSGILQKAEAQWDRRGVTLQVDDVPYTVWGRSAIDIEE